MIAKGNARELSYAYAAKAVQRRDAPFFACEWINPRVGQIVREVRLHATSGFINAQGKSAGNNGIVLAESRSQQMLVPLPTAE